MRKCPSLDAVVSAALQDAFESGYTACRRHLIRATLNAPDIEKCLPGIEAHRLAQLRQRAVLATNLLLDTTLFTRNPNHDLGTSAGFNTALIDATELALSLGAACVCPSHLLAVLINYTDPDDDNIGPEYWDWREVTVVHPANCS